VQCESNLLGIANGNGASVGSGGWANIIEKYRKAKQYCDNPFETRHDGTRKIRVPITGEWIGDTRDGASRQVRLLCQSATTADLQPDSLDGVFTDPPYFGNVQYAELMDFCLGKLQEGRLKPTRGDTRCIIFGHLVRMTIWHLRATWDGSRSAKRKLTTVSEYLARLPQPGEIEARLTVEVESPKARCAVNEPPAAYAAGTEDIAF